jgi:uncharacterized membrane protein YfcA
VSPSTIALLALVAFVAAAIGAITGGNSLLTVPALLLAGMDPGTAVGTNMLAVTFLCAGAAARFARARAIPRHPTLLLTVTALPGSVIGGLVAVRVSEATLRLIISTAMLAMSILFAAQPRLGEAPATRPPSLRAFGYVAMAAWAVYGGLFSGGYTTVLTMTCVLLLGTGLVETVALTKVVNLAGSAAATIVFIAQGRVDVTVGVVMSVAMALGGWAGAHVALARGTAWVRRAFLLTVVVLALKLLRDALA